MRQLLTLVVLSSFLIGCPGGGGSGGSSGGGSSSEPVSITFGGRNTSRVCSSADRPGPPSDPSHFVS